MESRSLFDGLAVLADPLRARILLVLEGRELSVSELCGVLQLPQSTMSRHLKALADEGWLVFRAEGTSRRYSMPGARLAPELRRIWTVVRDAVGGLPIAAVDAERLGAILAERRSRSREFFSSAAGEWDRLRRELLGRRLDLLALLGLLDEEWLVGDLGCGTGQVAESLAPFVGKVIGIDGSEAMLEAAARRLEGRENVELRLGELERLPVATGELDAVVIFLSLQYVVEPGAAILEARRALRPGGRLLIADLAPHDREEYRQRLGHQGLGLSEGEVMGWVGEAGLRRGRYTLLPPEPEAKGPALFIATARRGSENWNGTAVGPIRPEHTNRSEK